MGEGGERGVMEYGGGGCEGGVWWRRGGGGGSVMKGLGGDGCGGGNSISDRVVVVGTMKQLKMEKRVKPRVKEWKERGGGGGVMGDGGEGSVMEYGGGGGEGGVWWQRGGSGESVMKGLGGNGCGSDTSISDWVVVVGTMKQLKWK
ncbi:glycine-rich cell wall structural protein 1.0-like [Vicia villosa]|uniref:glycine-rich cell wall structural protein 1.0-like n=1 Tax=Vicia villosa TaxID=3911 RepID=UPI00273C4688|nr:glycine-rich cell wall structural protein 1.0-like [Vicia villosa]